MANSVVIDEYPNTVAQNATINENYKEAAHKVAESAIADFLDLCKVVRTTADCTHISAHLANWAKEHNLNPVVDEFLNVYWDVPASPGCENWPKIIFQTHQDMVWETKNTASPDPKPVDAVYDEETGAIHSRNFETTLGADPGEGIITLLALSKDYGFKHGPLRIIFTTKEETTMDGAYGLSSEVLDSDFMVNIDGRQAGIVRIFSCGVRTFVYKKNYEMTKSEHDTQIKINVDGLLGGHSANSIIYKRVSAIDVLRNVMNRLVERNINFDFISLEGGQNFNAIAYSAEMKLACSNDDVDAIKEISNSVIDEQMANSVDDKNGKCNFEVSDLTSEVFNSEATKQITELLNAFHNELFDMFEEVELVPKNSLNMGVTSIKDGTLDFTLMYRFGEEEFLKKLEKFNDEVSKKLQINYEVIETLPA